MREASARLSHLRLISATLAIALAAAAAVPHAAVSQQAPPERSSFAYPVKFLCGPSSEAFQEGMVTGFAATAINILNPSAAHLVRFTKHVSRAFPYQAPGPVSATIEDRLRPLAAIEIECNEIRQMLPSQMTEEFRTGYLIIRSDARLIVSAVYSARPRDGEIATLDVELIEGIEDRAAAQPDLTVTEIDIDRLRNRCPGGQGTCVATVPVTIANIGAADAGAFRVRVTFDPNQSVVVLRDFPGLAAGASETFNAQTPPSNNCYDPNCRICAFADSQEVVGESNEGNNQLCREGQG
jgi:hypothetical protein